MKFEAITIKDIAKALGLSTSTVSRALRDSYEISAETRKLVLEYAQRLNYRPNPIAQSLKEKRSRSIGIVVCEIANNFFSQVINGIESVAYKKGYYVIISQSHESFEREVANTQYLASRSVDGLLVSLSTETTDLSHLKKLHDKGLPIVFFDRITEEMGIVGFTNSPVTDIFHPALTCIRQPAFEMGQVAMELLIQLIEAKHPITKFETRVLNTELAVRASSQKA